MVHLSGNPTWQDWPSTATLITAAKLEAVEGAIDGMAATATPPVCQVKLTVNTAIAAVTDLYAQGNWAAVGPDPFSMVKVPPGSGTYTYVQIPNGWGGRYVMRYHATTSGMLSGGTHAGKISLNAANAASAIGTAMNTVGGAGADGGVIDVIAEAVLSAGDKIYWGNYTSVATTIPAVPAGISVPTAMYVRYVGPA